MNKLLLTIDGLIESVNKSKDPTLIGSLADKLSKLSATIEKLDKKEIFSKFSENSRKTQCVDEIVQIRYNNFIYGFFKAAV